VSRDTPWREADQLVEQRQQAISCVEIASKIRARAPGQHYSVGTMVRALASLIVVCLVAATGVRPAAAAPEQRSTLNVARTSERLHARVIEAASHGRVVSQTSGAARISRVPGTQSPELPAIAAASGLALTRPAACSVGPTAPGSQVVAVRPISTCSARGPPVV